MISMTTAALALALAQTPQAPAPAATPAPAPAADAAAAPPAGPSLTLDDALKRAQDANLDLKAAQARLTQAKAGVWKAWSFHLPQVTAGGTYTHNSEGAELKLPVGYAVRERTGGAGEPPPDPAGLPGAPTGTTPGTPQLFTTPSQVVSATIQKQDQVGGQIQVNQALFAPSLWFTIRAAYQGESVAEKSVEAIRREVLFGVAQTYYGVTSLKKVVDVSQRLLEIAQRQEKDAEVRYKAGTIAKVGFLRAEIDRARAEQDLRRARNAYDAARLSLAYLLDRDAAFEVVEPTEPALPADVTGLEQSALTDRPDVQAARLSEDLAGSLRKATAMGYLPSVGAFGRWQVSNVSGFTGKYDTWAVGLGLSWTILDGGLREAQLREQSARIAEATASRRSLENRAVVEVKQALLDLESARANALKAKEQRDLAAENQRLVDVSFKAGAATAVEQADATASLRNAEIAATTEELSAQLAALRVLKAAGAFEPTR
ncbi:MAG TPA: TolC family protein [Anaeromyxobacteraceae bacterium]|nr:TolC family protein [Anaeromyxobacteraceae bacterium]